MKRWTFINRTEQRKGALLLAVGVLLALALLAGGFGCAAPAKGPVPTTAPTYAPPAPTITAPPQTARPAPSPVPSPTPAPVPRPPGGVSAPSATTAPAPSSPNIGLATGGAKDINNFRENIKNNYLPLPTDVTYEGLFYDYYFDTGQTGKCNKLFCPSYSYAVTSDPFSGKTEYYLSVGLNSGMKESDFQRKKLNLVVVLDKSGSMQEQFNRYYYDRFGNVAKLEDSGTGWNKSKMSSATESVAAILDHLNADDRFGLVLFDSNAFLAKQLKSLDDVDIDGMKREILKISAGGSTNMPAGMKMGSDLFKDFIDVDPYEYENRIIFLTDAQPNVGDTSESSFMGMLNRNAENGIYATFIGIGVDFNTELIESITKVKGANYYSVHSPGQFMERMDEEFEFMVTPLVFNLQMTLESSGWRIEKVFGSPEADEATGKLMKINTLFPSKTEGGETKGGLVLLKLRKISSGNTLKLRVSYEDRNGRKDSSEASILLEGTPPEFFDNMGIQKGILLSRYAALLKNWMVDEREHAHFSSPWNPCVDKDVGIILPPPDYSLLGRWERQSLPLMVSSPYKKLFAEFADYFEAGMKDIGDKTLSQELEILNRLSGH